MKPKEIEFNAGDLVKSVEDLARHAKGKEKLALRSIGLYAAAPN